MFNEKYNQIQSLLEEDSIYISLDGTTTKSGAQVAAFIVGSLNDKLNGPFLINVKEMKDGTAQSYYEFLQESLNMLYAGKGNY